MARILATVNLKGGVGKTTTTAALGEFLSAEFGKRVLLVDLDPQTNLTTMMIGESRWQKLNIQGLTLATLFGEAVEPRGEVFELDRAIQRDVSSIRAAREVDLLASSLDLMEIQEGLSFQHYGDPGSTRPIDILRTALSRVVRNYDYVLIDCPPNLGMLTRNGLRLAQGYLIPTIPDILSTYGIPQLQSRVQDFAIKYDHPLKEVGLVVTKYRAASQVHRDTVNFLQRDRRIANVIPAFIPEANQIASAAENTNQRTLKGKYGQQFDALKNLTADVLTAVEVAL